MWNILGNTSGVVWKYSGTEVVVPVAVTVTVVCLRSIHAALEKPAAASKIRQSMMMDSLGDSEESSDRQEEKRQSRKYFHLYESSS